MAGRAPSSRVAAAKKAAETKKTTTLARADTRTSARQAIAATTKKPTKKDAVAAEPKKAAPAKSKTAPVKTASAASTTAAKPSSSRSRAPAKKATAAAPTSSSRKRKADDEPESDDGPDEPATTNGRAQKKAKVAPEKKAAAPKKVAAPKPPPAPKPAKKLPIINTRPTERFQVFVHGEGSSGELGLGPGAKNIDVKRPRLVSDLDAEKVGVVQLACGGMHTIALTHDGKVITWGVNDDGALGRDTNWDGGLRDMDAEGDSDSEDGDLNPLESKPGEVDLGRLPPGTNIVQVAACDSASFVLTDTGLVYGWGVFRDSSGNWGFSLDRKGEIIRLQLEPLLIPNLKNITKIVGSQNFALALDIKGNAYAWGNGQQNELGHRVVERRRDQCLVPTLIGLPRNKVADISAGAYHAFAVDKSGDVWTWGANNFGQTGIPDNAGTANASIVPPQKIAALSDRKDHDLSLSGGNHHSLLLDNTTGEVLTWGRVDGCQVGFNQEQLEVIAKEKPDSVIRSISEFTEENAVEQGMDPNDPSIRASIDAAAKRAERVRILLEPTIVQSFPPATTKESKRATKAVFGRALQEHNFVVGDNGNLYSWGFNTNYQCGMGHTDDVEVPELSFSKGIADQQVVSATGGGQFSVVLVKWDGKSTASKKDA